MANYRYLVEYDPDPDLSYLDQPEFSEVDKDIIVTYQIFVMVKCRCCGGSTFATNLDLPALGGIDVKEGSEDDIGPGTYELHELPYVMAENWRHLE